MTETEQLQSQVAIRRKKITNADVDIFVEHILKITKISELVAKQTEIKDFIKKSTDSKEDLVEQKAILDDIISSRRTIEKHKTQYHLSRAFGVLIIIVAVFIFFKFLVWIYDTNTKIHREARVVEEIVSNHKYDGEVWQVTSYLKRQLRDPDSYQSIKWYKASKESDHYLVRHRYRAKNGFGGYMIEDKVFKLDDKGNVIFMLDYGK